MTDLEIEQKIAEVNEIIQLNGIEILDDYYQDIYRDKYAKEIFRTKSQRFFESQEDADNVLNETLSQLTTFATNNVTP